MRHVPFYVLFLTAQIGLGQTLSYRTPGESKALAYSSLIAWGGIKVWTATEGERMLRATQRLDPDRLLDLDRRVIQKAPKRNSSRLSDYVLLTSIAAPIALAARSRDHWKEVALVCAQGFLIENTLAQLTKQVVRRPRPGVYRQGPDVRMRALHPNSTRSFYSGHASTTAYFAVVTARLLIELSPRESTKILAWSGVAGLSTAVSIARVRAGKHFWTDVVVGSLVGGTIGYVTPALVRSNRVRVHGSGHGIALSWRF